MAKYLNLKNSKDLKKWEEITDLGHDANLHRCPYGQDFKQSKSCEYYEPCLDTEDEDLGECSFVLFSSGKGFCELMPKEEANE